MKPRMVKCHNPRCRKIFNEHTSPSGSPLFCTKPCEVVHGVILRSTVDRLKAAGFVLDQEVPNLWKRGTTVLSTEFCMRQETLSDFLDKVDEMDASGRPSDPRYADAETD